MAMSKLPTQKISEIYSCSNVWYYFILMLIFLQDPKFLASANYQRSMEERKEDEIALIRLKQQEEQKLQDQIDEFNSSGKKAQAQVTLDARGRPLNTI